jgi:retron-type reverse transcriptase
MRTTEQTKEVKLPGAEQRAEVARARDKEQANTELWKKILGKENLLTALKRVERNGGAPGIDGMPVEELRPYLKENWLEIRETLDQQTYRPKPVRLKEIEKPDGGVRRLGIPTVMDRFLQQAITQVLTPLFEPMFSEHS